MTYFLSLILAHEMKEKIGYFSAEIPVYLLWQILNHKSRTISLHFLFAVLSFSLHFFIIIFLLSTQARLEFPKIQVHEVQQVIRMQLYSWLWLSVGLLVSVST